MSLEPNPDLRLARSPPVRLYTLVCLLALLFILVVLLDRGLGEWSLMPVVLGCITLLLHVRAGPPLVLLSLTWLVLAQTRGTDPGRWLRYVVLRGQLPPTRILEQTSGLSPSDLLLCSAMLVFVVGFYRVEAMVHHLFPVDPRRKKWARQQGAQAGIHSVSAALERRLPEKVEKRELPLLVGVALAWSLLACVFWHLLSAETVPAGFNFPVWRLLVLLWLFGMGVILFVAVLAYLDQVRAGPEAGRIYLQDQLWQETRREQSRINRWLVGARLWWQKWKEKR